MSARSTSILVVGLGLKAVQKIRPDFTEEAYKKILSSLKTMDDIPHLSYRLAVLDSETLSDNAADGIADFKKELVNAPKDGSGIWSGVLIGGGIKALPEMTTLLEGLINTTASTTGGRTKIMFSVNGGDHLDVLARNFPELVKS